LRFRSPRNLRLVHVLPALCAAVLAACGAPSAPAISLDRANPSRPLVIVSGLSRRDLGAIERARLAPAAWAAMFRVSVAAAAATEQPPVAVAGRYEVRGGALVFTPMFPLDAGRAYDVVFDPDAALAPGLAEVPGGSARLTVPVEPDTAPATTVSAVYPGGAEVPANLLRMYVEFSAPMGSRDGQNYVAILDAQGRELADAVLPLDTGLWNPDHTRFTILFDPGRVKRGILPNRRAGRPLQSGQTFSIVVRRDWPDGRARPLAADFHREYRVGPAIERALKTSDWRITAPAAGSRDPLVVEFPWPLDRGLVQRALDVAAGSATIDGTARIEDGERRWTFVPAQPWQARAHALVAQPELEDPSGNRVGRAFETLDSTDDTQRQPARIAFQPR
jgi:hypothetical protein